ncbi:HNH endonuclease [Brevibacillus centrosporus]|uniref:HNH endonuclease n=1 Tax=Brevibacillus centrosporus TaxID=54910 RepID=UPI002E2288D4|nr:HNH endonuclease [Brevibacillus centrosporus]
MKNRYEIRGNVTAIFLERKDGSIFETLIDTEDLGIVQKHRWFAYKSTTTQKFYAKAQDYIDQKVVDIRLHRLLTNAPKGMFVDHINHDPLDNRRSNLRVVSNMENMQNRSGSQRNSKSGVRGVSWSKKQNRWKAAIGVNGKSMYLGAFTTIEEAEKVVVNARKIYMPFSYMDQGP